jgi:capsular polysaccharide biosynthesis protein
MYLETGALNPPGALPLSSPPLALATNTQDSFRDAPAPAMPPAGSPFLRAAARRWWLILLPALALLAVAIFLGLSRAPTYTARTQANVGSIDARTQALPGFVEGAKSLASAYSRFVVSDRIIDATARRVGMSSAEVRRRITATPVPSAPIVTILATGPSGEEARRVADAAMLELSDYVKKLEGASSRSARLLSEYRARTNSANLLQARYDRLRAARQNDSGSVSAARITEVKTQADTDRLRAQTLGQMYSDARARDEGAAEISLLNSATSATSDRNSVLQRLAFVGFFGGAAIGLGLVAMWEGRRRRRHRPRPR